jgi:hypothetical protein
MLQPLEELQNCNAQAKRSIDMNYSSLPPQLVVFKAIMSKHFVLAAVCTMGLLANLLAIAFAGLFNQGLTDVPYTATFQPPYISKFVPINGSIGPSNVANFGSLESSGAYHGGNGEDQFLIAESNFTRNTSLPAWTDNKLFYLPVFIDHITSQGNASQFEATTNAFGAELDCTELKLGQNLAIRPAATSDYKGFTIAGFLDVTVPSQFGSVPCASVGFSVEPGPYQDKPTCVSGTSAVELVAVLQPQANATQQEKEVCMSTVLLAWIRNPNGTCPLGSIAKVTEQNALFVQCRQNLVTGSAKIRIDQSGRLQQAAEDVKVNAITGSKLQSLFSTDPINLIRQSNLYLFNNGQQNAFHNDSFANDFINYFVSRVTNSTHFTDPNQPVPTFDEVAGPLNRTYAKLFAIWLGTNKKNLLVPHTTDDAVQVEGLRIELEQRLFVSTTMFIISEAILCTYVIVAIWVYIRRPGQYLARLPTSIASLIALFAASNAVTDMQGTSHLDTKGRAQHLERVDAQYGYGSFVGGGDGRVHIGIEKRPFVRRRRVKTTWLDQKLPSFRKDSAGGD